VKRRPVVLDQRVFRTKARSSFWQGFPLVGQKFPQSADRVAHDSPQEVVEVFPGIDVAVFAGLDEAHEQGRGPATPFAADE